MRATWAFRAARPGGVRSWIRRACGQPAFTGTEQDALEFARAATEHLSHTSVSWVEAWSVGSVEGAAELPGAVRFRIVPHPNGKDWAAEEGELMHPLWITQLDFGIDYALFRGGGKLCVLEVVNRAGAIERVVLADKRGVESCPTKPPSAGLRCDTESPGNR